MGPTSMSLPRADLLVCVSPQLVGITPLVIAAEFQKEDVFALLLDSKAAVDAVEV